MKIIIRSKYFKREYCSTASVNGYSTRTNSTTHRSRKTPLICRSLPSTPAATSTGASRTISPQALGYDG